MKKTTTTNSDDFGKRIDAVLAAKFAKSSRSALKKLIEAGAVSTNGKIISEPKTRIKSAMTIEVEFRDPRPQGSLQGIPQDTVAGENIPLNIIHEDDFIIVLNKPAGIAVHSGAGNENKTIVNALVGKNANFAKAFDDSVRPGIVHRLDKDSSGCLIVAKTQEAQETLVRLFASRQVEKIYLAVTCAVPKEKAAVIDTFFGRHPTSRKKMAALKHSNRRAITEYRLLKEINVGRQRCALLEVKPKTGRTHQIRVHLAHIRCPILGDKTYGGKQKISAPRQLLHAWKISFPHPRDGKIASLESPPPDDFIPYL